MKSIQEIFSGKEKSIEIPAGEYEGPLRIGHACSVDGHGATLWTKSGPALMVEADGVVLENLRIETTDHPEGTVAAILRNDTATKNVEVYGQVERAGKLSHWNLPRLLDLGAFAPERTNEFHRRIAVDSPCEITNHVHGLEVSPGTLSSGENDVTFKISPLMGDTILYGDIVLKTGDGICKRIYVSGRAVPGAKEIHEQKLHACGKSAAPPVARVTKGQRLPLMHAKKLFVCFRGENIKTDIDPYAFQLYGNGKTRRDKDLVFFGNEQSESDGVYIAHKDGKQGVGICLGNVPEDVETIVVSFAIYEEEGKRNAYFSGVRNPLARFYVDEKEYEFPLELGLEKVVNILEVYRYQGEWKVRFVGAGFRDGLKKLCEQYGVAVK